MKKVITCGTCDLLHVVYLPRTKGVSTTRTKARLRLTESSNIEFEE